jgi:nicotinamidase-related amidase
LRPITLFVCAPRAVQPSPGFVLTTNGQGMKKGSAKNSSDRRSAAALLLIDVVNDFAFPEADLLLKHAIPMAHKVAALKRRCTRAGIPSLYINDNFGLWRSCLDEQIEYCLNQEPPGRAVVEMLLPQPDDYFILKPKRSAFFDTPLETILRTLEAKTLIVTGLATDMCVYFTASDANMRNFDLLIPSDCVAANTLKIHKQSLEKMAELFSADTRPSSELGLKTLRRLQAPAI